MRWLDQLKMLIRGQELMLMQEQQPSMIDALSLTSLLCLKKMVQNRLALDLCMLKSEPWGPFIRRI
ncbi:MULTISPECIES: hypothetical protein [unclassified Anaerobiospirillum]|uniref:hypothetical protein n=1 Tax=unclassified Anaerobiospirillum TaxID=2647410 RepID=UPI001FF4D8EA|nr:MULTISPECIES: hypothetical protein [unclassified Anaerobiospirillum]MCK0533985.1 hypothetical protein [Anaerobiospirillum sp. NML120511]MCK0539271.1 hypothetical protein [Anaerobiospirillum sp. NML02-A-032]